MTQRYRASAAFVADNKSKISGFGKSYGCRVANFAEMTEEDMARRARNQRLGGAAGAGAIGIGAAGGLAATGGINGIARQFDSQPELPFTDRVGAYASERLGQAQAAAQNLSGYANVSPYASPQEFLKAQGQNALESGAKYVRGGGQALQPYLDSARSAGANLAAQSQELALDARLGIGHQLGRLQPGGDALPFSPYNPEYAEGFNRLLGKIPQVLRSGE